MANNTRNIFVRLALKDLLSSQMKAVNNSLYNTQKSVQGLTASMGGLAGSFAGFYAAFSQFQSGLQYVEDFKVSVASLAGFMVTFSRKTAEGDVAGAFRDAVGYAEQLIPALEIMDARTVATGRELKLMTETMLMYGTVLDINNKKQVDGFVSMTNALKLLTKGQNQEIQMRQEVHALMMGQMRMTDRLPKLLQAVHAQQNKNGLSLQDQLDQWREQGTLIENVGKMLEGFNIIVPMIQKTWASVGTTMKTIYQVILRDGMLPVYEDLMNIAIQFNALLRDEETGYTDLANAIKINIQTAWEDVKVIIGSVSLTAQTLYEVFDILLEPIKLLGKGMYAFAKQAQLVAMVFTTWINLKVAKFFYTLATSISFTGTTLDRVTRRFGKFNAVLIYTRHTIRSLWRFLMGPAGLIVTIGFLATEFATWASFSKLAADNTWDFSSSVEDLTEKFRSMNDALLNAEVTKYGQKIRETEEKILSFRDSLNTMRGDKVIDPVAESMGIDPRHQFDDTALKESITLMEGRIAEEEARLEKLKEIRQAAIDAVDDPNRRGGMPELLRQRADEIGAVSKWKDELEKLRMQFAGTGTERIKLEYDKRLADLDVHHQERLQSVVTANKGLWEVQVEKGRVEDEYQKARNILILSRDKALADEREKIANKSYQEKIKYYKEEAQKFLTTFQPSGKAAGADIMPTEGLSESIEEVSQAFQTAGLLNEKMRDKRIADAKKVYDTLIKYGANEVAAFKWLTEEKEQINAEFTGEIVDKNKEAAEEIKSAFQGWASGFASDLSDIVWSADFSFEKIAESFGKMLTTMIIQYKVVKPIFEGLFGAEGSGGGVLGGLWNSFAGWLTAAKGAVLPYNPAGISAYSNSVVSTPTIVPFASGGALFGEAGPEAIMPLTETASGELAVNAVGASGSNVNVIINTPAGLQASYAEQDNNNGGVDLEVWFDKVGAEKIGRHGTSMNTAVMGVTGANKPLKRR